MSEQITTALTKLDPTNDEHWTAQGLPRVETVAELAGLSDLKRSDITEAAPDFTRTNPQLPANGSTSTEPPSEPSDDDAAAPPTAEDDTPIVSEIAANLTALCAEKEAKETELAQVRGERALLKKREENLVKEIDALILKIEHDEPPMTLAAGIDAYLANQTKIAQQRANAAKGVTPDTLAPVDAVRRVPGAARRGYLLK